MSFNEPSRSPNTPDIPAHLIRSFSKLPHNYSEKYNDLRLTNPALARELFIVAAKSTDNDLERKRAFTEGALYMHSLLVFYEQYLRLEEKFNHQEGHSEEDTTNTPAE